MRKAVSLKELPDSYIRPGMSAEELSKYLCISKNTFQTWEKYFQFFPKNPGEELEYYTKDKIQEYIKVKRMFDKGKTLKEIKEDLFKNPFSNEPEVIEFDINKVNNAVNENNEDSFRPFLTLISRANDRVGELIIEKAKIIEESAIEKANLLSQVNGLKDKNLMLMEERDRLRQLIKEKEEILKKSAQQEINLGEALKTSQEILKQKDTEINLLRNQIKQHEIAIEEKTNIIKNQEVELNKLLQEKQERKWWMFWK